MIRGTLLGKSGKDGSNGAAEGSHKALGQAPELAGPHNPKFAESGATARNDMASLQNKAGDSLQEGQAPAKSTQKDDKDDKELCTTQDLDNRRLLMIIGACLLLLLLIAGFSTLYFAKAVFFPIALAFVIKLIFQPVVKRLRKWWIPEYVSAILIVGGIIGTSVLAISFLAGPATEWIQNAPQSLSDISYKLRSVREPIAKVSQAGEQVEALANVSGGEEPVEVQVSRPGVVATMLNTTTDVLLLAVTTLVLLFFFLAGGDRMLEKVISLTPEWGAKRKIVELARDVQYTLSSYLFSMTSINLVLGLVIGTGMWMIGLPNPILWGVMAAILNYIPYVGAMVGGCVVFLVGLVEFQTFGEALWAPAIYYGCNALEGYFITPAILGRSISLSPLAIVISMVLWGFIWGIGGIFLSVPILAATKVTCDHIPRLAPFGQMLGQ